MKQKLFFLILIIIQIFAFADNKDLLPVGSKQVAMGGCSVSNTGIWSVSNNQAGLGFLSETIAAMHYENRFGVKGVGYKSLAFATATSSGTFGLKLNYFGYDLYNDMEFGLVYGKSLGEKFSVGIGLNYLQTYIAHDYGKTGVLLAEIGIMSKPIDNLTIGATLYNVTRAKYSKTINEEKIPSIFKLGAEYNFSGDALLTAEIDKNIDYPMVFRAGVEFKVVKSLFLRTGISTNSTLLSFGLGYKTKKVSVDIAFSYHQYLGYSPFISLVYNFSK
jgi:long-subunit fatty acid transport protein